MSVRQVSSEGGHKKGCHCKKSRCLKKYCECYQANVPCTEACRYAAARSPAWLTFASSQTCCGTACCALLRDPLCLYRCENCENTGPSAPCDESPQESLFENGVRSRLHGFATTDGTAGCVGVTNMKLLILMRCDCSAGSSSGKPAECHEQSGISQYLHPSEFEYQRQRPCLLDLCLW